MTVCPYLDDDEEAPTVFLTDGSPHSDWAADMSPAEARRLAGALVAVADLVDPPGDD